jgi:ketosteroid isomerase-like protein
MSQEQIDVIQRGSRAFNEADIEGILEVAHPEVELNLIGGFAEVLGESTFSGHAGVRRLCMDWFATFETVRVDQEKFIEAGELLVSLSRYNATVPGSPAPVELFGGTVWGFREGKIVQWDAYYDPREALRAAGLSERDAHSS